MGQAITGLHAAKRGDQFDVLCLRKHVDPLHELESVRAAVEESAASRANVAGCN